MSSSSEKAALQIKLILAKSIKRKLSADRISISSFARQLKSQPVLVRRILDHANTGITLKTMTKAADALGLEISFQVRPQPLSKIEPLIGKYAATKSKAAAARLEDDIVAAYYGSQPSPPPQNHAKNPTRRSAGKPVPASASSR